MAHRPRLLSASVALLSITAASAAAQSTPAEVSPVVVTVGEGIVEAAPDRATVTIVAEARARGPKEAQSAAASIMSAVQKRLQDAQIPSDAIRTLGLDLQQEFDFSDGRQTPRGFVARHSIEVRIDAIDRVGAIIDLAVAAGATGISGIEFDVKDRVNLEREAIKRAVADARARAEAAAEGAGRAIDRVIKIDESRDSGRPPMPMMRAAMAEGAPSTPIAPGRIEIRARVTLTAALR